MEGLLLAAAPAASDPSEEAKVEFLVAAAERELSPTAAPLLLEVEGSLWLFSSNPLFLFDAEEEVRLP